MTTIDTDKNTHYNLPLGLQVLDIIRMSMTPEMFLGYLKGNVIKYTMREMEKGQRVFDLEKGLDYLSWYNEEVKQLSQKTS